MTKFLKRREIFVILINFVCFSYSYVCSLCCYSYVHVFLILLHQQKCHNKQCIPLSVTYRRALPNLRDITKHWSILQANQSCKETFSTIPIIFFRKGTNLKKIIGNNSIHNNDKLIKIRNNHHTGMCVPCNWTHCQFFPCNFYKGRN